MIWQKEVGKRARDSHLVGKTVISLGLGYGKEEKEAGFHLQRTGEILCQLTSDILSAGPGIISGKLSGAGGKKGMPGPGEPGLFKRNAVEFIY